LTQHLFVTGCIRSKLLATKVLCMIRIRAARRIRTASIWGRAVSLWSGWKQLQRSRLVGSCGYRSGPVAFVEAVRVSLAGGLVARLQSFLHAKFKRSCAHPSWGLAVPWHLQAILVEALTECFAKASAATTIAAQQHTMAANAASAAAMTRTSVHTYLTV